MTHAALSAAERFDRQVAEMKNGPKPLTLQDLQERSLDLVNLLTQPIEPPNYLIEPVLEVGDVVSLAARPGTGKSWFGYDLALALSDPDRGRFLSYKVLQHGRVLYLDSENRRAQALNRLKRLVRGNPAAAERLQYVSQPGLRLDEVEGRRLLRQLVETTRPVLVVFDSLVRFHHGDENSSTAMAQLAEAILPLSRDFDSAVLLIDHTAKGSGKKDALDAARGSSDKGAQVDRVWYFEGTADKESFIWQHGKQRDGPWIPDLLVRRHIEAESAWHEAEALGAPGPAKDTTTLLVHLSGVGEDYQANIADVCFGGVLDRARKAIAEAKRLGYLNPARRGGGRTKLYTVSPQGVEFIAQAGDKLAAA